MSSDPVNLLRPTFSDSVLFNTIRKLAHHFNRNCRKFYFVCEHVAFYIIFLLKMKEYRENKKVKMPDIMANTVNNALARGAKTAGKSYIVARY